MSPINGRDVAPGLQFFLQFVSLARELDINLVLFEKFWCSGEEEARLRGGTADPTLHNLG